MTDVVERTAAPAEQVQAAELLVAKLVQADCWLPPEFRQENEARYARRRLYADPLDRFEVIALVWKPGQETPLHDHDGTWGAEGVVCGEMTITNYDRAGTLPDGRVRLHPTGVSVVGPRATGQLLPPADCHIVANHGTDAAVTIHVYGKPLRKFLVFDPQPEAGVYAVREQAVTG